VIDVNLHSSFQQYLSVGHDVSSTGLYQFNISPSVMIKSIGTTAVVVSDVAKSSEWYRDKLGLEVQGDPKMHWVTAGIKGSEHRLHL
jgi:catechol-2,3-dioxygenase